MKADLEFFLSYARHDTARLAPLVSELDVHLAASQKFGFQKWRDTGILLGEEWDDQIKGAAERCQVGLLMISPAFLGRPYIVKEELPRLREEGKVILPVMAVRVDLSLMDMHGLDQLQLFTLPDGKGGGLAWNECHDDRERDQFVLKLYQDIERRLSVSF